MAHFDHNISKEMGITRNDLLRALPAVFQDQIYTVKGDTITAKNAQNSIRITIVKESFRELVSMKIPLLKLDFRFTGYQPEQVDSFMQRFLLYLHKGGG